MSDDFEQGQPSEDNYADAKEQQETTAKKSNNAESRYQSNTKQTQDKSSEDAELDDFENRINDIGNQLEQIHLESLRVDNSNFAKRRELESLRRDLKKELIDVGHDHKQLTINKEERAKGRKKEEEEERIR